MPFSSFLFKDFAKKWDMTLTTSSPTYPQSNGMVERAIQTIKQLLRKADYEGKDPYLALLNYRTTPLSGIGSSPAEMLMGRAIRNQLPFQDFHRQSNDDLKEKLQRKQELQKLYYDKGKKELSDLDLDHPVLVRKGKEWRPAVVKQKATQPRPYSLEDDQGTTLRRNRIEVKPVPEDEMKNSFQLPKRKGGTTDSAINEDVKRFHKGYVTASGRLSKPSERYGE